MNTNHRLTLSQFVLCAGFLALSPSPAGAQKPPLLPETTVVALAQELSGETAKRNLEFLTRLHRMRGSRDFHAAAEFIAERARSHGLADARVEQFPADGKTFYGTQKARPAWDADFAELWTVQKSGTDWIPAERLASWEAMPITLAQDSESAEVTAELVDVGEGTKESDYAGRDVRGKIVLAGAQPGPVAALAVAKFGAAGIVSYAQNQRTAWWGEDENFVRWGHLDSFAATKTFAFMVSLKRARELRQRMAAGETVRLHAVVRAGRRPGFYDVVTATIPGADERLRNEEIVFSCHLDHQKPGANDNASGCATILEVARSLSKLIAEGKLARPARTLRFVWPPEIEGSLVYLNSHAEIVSRMKAVVHMDMVGGGPETKAIFHITRGPASLPSFVNDVAEAFGEFANAQTSEFAATGRAAFPLVAPEGGKEWLRAEFAEFSMGSDHEVYTEGSFRIPAVYFNDWPDRYIHTNFDSAANIDPTKLKRAGFLGAAAGYFLAGVTAADAQALLRVIESRALARAGVMLERRSALEAAGGSDAVREAANLTRFHLAYERGIADSLERFFAVPAEVRNAARNFLTRLEALVGDGASASWTTRDPGVVFQRNAQPRGPMTVFGYDYFADHYGAERARGVRLLSFNGLRSAGGEYAYEALNFVDGRRTAEEIRDAVSAEYGPVPLDVVAEYLHALESIGVVRAGNARPAR